MRRLGLLALGALLLGCPTADDDDSAAAATSDLAVVTRFEFSPEEPEGFSTGGFNLDGVDSGDGTSDGCGVGDLVHAETGEPGIDNTIGWKLMPALEQIGGQAVGDLIQNAILDGELLLMLEMDGIDDPVNDDCVGFTLSRGIGPPMIGGDGEILPDQTYGRDLEQPVSQVECAVITDGVLRASDFSIRLPISIFDEFVDVTLLDAVLEVRFLEDGHIQGEIGGGVDIEALKATVATLDGIGDQIPALIGPLLDLNADLAPTNLGSCTQISVAVNYSGVGAWFYD